MLIFSSYVVYHVHHLSGLTGTKPKVIISFGGCFVINQSTEPSEIGTCSPVVFILFQQNMDTLNVYVSRVSNQHFYNMCHVTFRLRWMTFTSGCGGDFGGMTAKTWLPSERRLFKVAFVRASEPTGYV